MAFKLPKNVVSKNNMKNILYLVTLALAVAYLMNRENIALISLVVVAGTIYMLKKDVVIALGVSIVVTNLLLAMNFFKRFKKVEGFSFFDKDKKDKNEKDLIDDKLIMKWKDIFNDDDKIRIKDGDKPVHKDELEKWIDMMPKAFEEQRENRKKLEKQKKDK